MRVPFLKFYVSATLALSTAVVSFPSQAALEARTGASGVQMVYATTQNVTFIKDANLFKTQVDANANIINQIIAGTPTISDPFWGDRTLDATDFHTDDGHMSIYGAIAWVNWLNAQSYGGYNDWRLPTAKPVNGSANNYLLGPNDFTGNRDKSYNITSTQSEAAHLFHSQLGFKSGITTANQPAAAGTFGAFCTTCNPDLVFSNIQRGTYWTGSQAPDGSDDDGKNFFFSFNSGLQSTQDRENTQAMWAWAVRTGDVSNVPVPAAVWLLGSALAGMTTISRRRRA